jgi:hypothetical protein
VRKVQNKLSQIKGLKKKTRERERGKEKKKQKVHQ